MKLIIKIICMILAFSFIFSVSGCSKQGTNFTVKFINGDRVLQIKKFAEPAVPVYTASKPKKNNEYNGKEELSKFVFSGWNPKIQKVSENTNFIAEFDEIKYKETEISKIEDIKSEEIKDIFWKKGRTYIKDDYLFFNNISSGFEISFYGSKLTVNLKAESCDETLPSIGVVLDDNTFCREKYFLEKQIDNVIEINTDNKFHTIKIIKLDTAEISSIGIKSLETDGKFYSKTLPLEKSQMFIEVYADFSVTGKNDIDFDLDDENNQIQDKLEKDEYKADFTNSFLGYSKLPYSSNISVISNEKISLVENDSTILLDNFFDKTYTSKMNYLTNSEENPIYNFENNPNIVILSLGYSDIIYEAKTEEIILSYKNFINKLIEKYNENTKFILCSGIYNKSLNDPIKSFIKELDNNNLFYLEFEKRNDKLPTQSELKSYAKKLDLLIENITSNVDNIVKLENTAEY